MADADTKQRCVAGFIKRPIDNKDGSYSFWVAGQRFVVPTKSEHYAKLVKAKRALVLFERRENNNNPRITLVFENPSARLIVQYMRDSEKF